MYLLLRACNAVIISVNQGQAAFSMWVIPMMPGFLIGQAGPEQNISMYCQKHFLAKFLKPAGHSEFACGP